MITARRLGRVWTAMLAIGGAAALQAYNIADYFPLAAGNRWHLVDGTPSADTDAFVWTVLGTGPQTVGSFSVWKLKTTCDDTHDFRNLDEDFWNYYDTATSLPKLGLYGFYKGTAASGVPTQTVVFSRPLYLGDANMALTPAPWSKTSTATASVTLDLPWPLGGSQSGTLTATSTLEAHFDTFATPLGVFKDVIRLKVNVTATVKKTISIPFVGDRDYEHTFDFIDSRFWLARGVGLIRQNQKLDPDDAVYQVLDSGQVNGQPIDFHTLTFQAGLGGSVSPAASQTVVHGGSAAAVTASPATGYHFVGWTSGGASYPGTATLTVNPVNASLTLRAEFALDSYRVDFEASAGGAITGTTPQFIVRNGSTTAVIANALTGYHFDRWTRGGAFYPGTATLTVNNVTEAMTLRAEFLPYIYTVTFAAEPTAGGSIAGVTSQNVAHGNSTTAVTANAATGYHFVQWTSLGTLYPGAATLTINPVTANLDLKAVFARNSYTFNYAAGSYGTLIGTARQTVLYGDRTTPVEARPNTGYRFEQWSDSSTANPRQDTSVDSDLAVTAMFVPVVAPVEVQVMPSSLAVACRRGTIPASTTFSVRNALDGTISYTITEGIDWLNVSPTSGTSSGEWDEITVSFTAAAAGLDTGLHSGDITVTSGSSVKTVHVTLNVSNQLTFRQFPAGCYSPGDTVEVSILIDLAYVGTVTSVAIRETLPAGWEFVELIGSPDGDDPSASDNAGTIEFYWIGVPTFPRTLTYKVHIPAGATRNTYCFAGNNDYRLDGGLVLFDTMGETCLDIGDCCVPHQADQNGNWRIDLTQELTRMIQFYNVRAYHCAPVGTPSEDGYATGTGTRTCTPHQADQNGDWIIQLSPELTRLIQFYNSGGYHCQEGTEDGYAPGLALRKSSSASQGTLAAARRFDSALYDDTSTLDVSVTLSHTNPTALTALSLTEELPPGWTFAGLVTNKATGSEPPTLVRADDDSGSVDFAWITMPEQWPLTLTYRVNVPTGSVGNQTFTGTATCREDAGPLSAPIPASTLTPSPRTPVAVDPSGSFLAVLDPTAPAVGQGLWDLTGTYSITVADNPLTLNLTHDNKGRLSGFATLTVDVGKQIVPVTLPLRGSARGRGENLLVNLTMRGSDPGTAVTAALSFNLALNATTRQLVGPVTGHLEVNAATRLVSDIATLDIPKPMNGAWTLRFDLTSAGTSVTGSATLTLSNDVQCLYTLRGERCGLTVVASLAGVTDPTAKSIRTSITPLTGGGARLHTLSGRSYGQSLLLRR